MFINIFYIKIYNRMYGNSRKSIISINRPSQIFEKAVLEEHNLKNLMGLVTFLQGRIIDFLV